MTTMKIKKILFKKGWRYCLVDNHNKKTGKSYAVLYKAKNPAQLCRYMLEKGIIDEGSL